MEAATRGTFDHPLVRVAWWDTGPAPTPPESPPALLFIHGALCDQNDWAPTIEHFRSHHRCVALDLPGHGASPADPSAIGIAPYARVVRDLATSLGLRDVVLVAHSMGCRVALQAAVGLDGEGAWSGLRGLVLVDGAYLAPRLLDGESVSQREALAAAARERAAGLYAAQDPADRAARGFGQMFFDERFHSIRDRMIERARGLPPHVARTLMPDFAAWDVAHMETALAQVKVPVLALVCTFMNNAHERARLQADTRTPWMHALERHVPEATVQRIPDAGHFPMLEQPDLTHGRIAAWLTASTTTTKETAP
jgi:pimeloyl-ACP methyl ester carboxylesterase